MRAIVMRSLLLVVLLALPAASAQTVEEWVHGKIATQKGILKPVTPAALGPSGQLWK